MRGSENSPIPTSPRSILEPLRSLFQWEGARPLLSPPCLLFSHRPSRSPCRRSRRSSSGRHLFRTVERGSTHRGILGIDCLLTSAERVKYRGPSAQSSTMPAVPRTPVKIRRAWCHHHGTLCCWRATALPQWRPTQSPPCWYPSMTRKRPSAQRSDRLSEVKRKKTTALLLHCLEK